MKKFNRDLLVLYKSHTLDAELLQHEVEFLHQMLLSVECSETFCRVHELVTRNKITRRSSHLIKAAQSATLPAFQFLLNNN